MQFAPAADAPVGQLRRGSVGRAGRYLRSVFAKRALMAQAKVVVIRLAAQVAHARRRLDAQLVGQPGGIAAQGLALFVEAA